ncbi:MAG: branched-chain amino acid ABC transporter permease [Gammaproteobacteria bacterium]|nr:branched-chain amino acid ABC transporter permease [Gammaproteobacteria bacterium]
MDPILLLQQLANGLVMGSIYAMIAVGLALIFGVLDIVNFAHGELYMIGAMATWFVAERIGLGYLQSIPVTTLIGLVLGYAVYRLVRDTGGSIERAIILTTGLAMVLQSSAMLLWSATPREVHFPAATGLFELGPVVMPRVRAIAFVAAAGCIALLYVFLHHTHLGRTIRAVAQNPRAAAMVGINAHAAIRLAVITGVVLAVLAGTLLAPMYAVHPVMGLGFLVKAFAIVIIGGMGSLLGAAVVAIGLGSFESLSSLWLSAVAAEAITFVLMIAILLVRPQGLFGRSARL